MSEQQLNEIGMPPLSSDGQDLKRTFTQVRQRGQLSGTNIMEVRFERGARTLGRSPTMSQNPHQFSGQSQASASPAFRAASTLEHMRSSVSSTAHLGGTSIAGGSCNASSFRSRPNAFTSNANPSSPNVVSSDPMSGADQFGAAPASMMHSPTPAMFAIPRQQIAPVPVHGPVPMQLSQGAALPMPAYGSPAFGSQQPPSPLPMPAGFSCGSAPAQNCGTLAGFAWDSASAQGCGSPIPMGGSVRMSGSPVGDMRQFGAAPAYVQGRDSPATGINSPSGPPVNHSGSALHSSPGPAYFGASLYPDPNAQQILHPLGTCSPLSTGTPLGSSQTSPAANDETSPAKVESKRSFAEFSEEFQVVMDRARLKGYPVGPIAVADTQRLKDHVKAITLDPSTMGGSFGVSLGNVPRPAGRKGTVAELHCTEKKSKGCKMSLRYEYTNEGWALYSCTHDHTGHDLLQSKPAAMVTGAGRLLPASYDELGHLLAAASIAPKDIFRVLVTKHAADTGDDEPTFTYNDVYDRYCRSSVSSKLSDVLELIPKLADRKTKTGLEYFVESDGNNRLERLWVECANARQVWGTGRTKYKLGNVLIFDPTFGTNRYGMKLSLFVTVGPEGETVILAYLVHYEESYDDVFWGIKCFHTVFVDPPATFLTDSAAGILKAAEKFSLNEMPWFGVEHLLCVYHIDQNFYTNIRPLFSGNAEAWNLAHDMFWKLAKNSDLLLESVVVNQVNELRAHIVKEGRGKSKDKALNWYDNVLVPRMPKWVAYYTWSHFSAGGHASVRGEGMNAAVKKYIEASAGLFALHNKLEMYTQFKEFRDICKSQIRLAKSVKSNYEVPVFLNQVHGIISEYAYTMTLGQLHQVFAYTLECVPSEHKLSDTERFEPEGTNYFVARRDKNATAISVEQLSDGKTKSHQNLYDIGMADHANTHWTTFQSCSCQYITSYGMPCRHMLAIWVFQPKPWYCTFLSLYNHRWVNNLINNGIDVYEKIAECQECDDDDVEETACYNQCMRMLKSNGCKPLFPDAATLKISSFSGGFMALKYGSPNQGGWHIAKMTATEYSDEMELFFLFTDRRTALWLCDPRKMLKQLKRGQRCETRSWFLVQKEQLSQPTGGVVNPAPIDQRRGRPQVTRKRPAGGGPLSQ